MKRSHSQSGQAHPSAWLRLIHDAELAVLPEFESFLAACSCALVESISQARSKIQSFVVVYIL